MHLNFKENIDSENHELKKADYKITPSIEGDDWDVKIWKEFKNNNETAFQLFYKKYYPLLYNYGIRLSKDEDVIRDCIHDLFIDIWKYRARLTDPVSVKKYMFLSIRRKIIKVVIKNNKFVSYSLKIKNYSFDFELPHEDILINDQTLVDCNNKLLMAMNELTPKQKEAIYLKYYENMTSHEIASVMSLTINSTYVIISESMKVLKNCIKKYFPVIIAFCNYY